MGIVPIIRAARLVPVLMRLGFRVIRQVGSHAHLQHWLDKTRKVTIPVHNKDLPKKTLLSILKQAKLSLQDLLEMMRK